MIKLILSLTTAILCFSVSACNSSDDGSIMSDQAETLPGAGSSSPVTGDVQNDSESVVEALQCDADFDHAELLFTESDRQWSCSVASAELASSDDVFFSRNGAASFTRFGQVYWNRNLLTDEINIASPFIPSFVMKDITSSNTTLQFTVNADGEAGQQYDCVLVGRADIS